MAEGIAVRPAPRTGGARWRGPAAALLVLVLPTGGCGTGDAASPFPDPASELPNSGTERRPVEVLSAFASGDGTTVEIGVSSCDGDPTASTDETADEVAVRVTAEVVVEGDRFECQDVVPVTLGAPLGDRRLIDGSSGTAVPVERS